MNDKFIICDATDIAVIGGFGNLDGNLGLLKYNNEEIKQMIKENNNGNDNIRLIESLLGSLKELDQENQELKADYGTKAQVERDLLMEENQELKKKLEELELIVTLSKKRNLISKFNKEYDEEDKKKNPDRSHAEIMPDAEEVYKRYYAMKNQQKEFIEYISSCIELLNDKSDLVELSQKDVLEEILSKYKEIIGDDK